MQKIVRFGVSLENELLKKFDKLIKRKGYPSRSEALRDLIRDKLIGEVIEDERQEVIGTVTIIYDHRVRNVTDKLLDLQHSFHKNIRSTTHTHLDDRNCLEVLVLDGKARQVKGLADRVMSIKGVKHGKLTLTQKI